MPATSQVTLPSARRRALVLVGCLSVLLCLAWSVRLSAAPTPKLIFPSGNDKALIAQRCPTFSWSLAPDASSYELVIFELEDSREEPRQVARVTLPEGATSWTPEAADCLQAGVDYAWTIRAGGSDGPGEWSAAALFEVRAPSPGEVSEALDVLRRYLEGRRSDTAQDAAAAPPPSAGARHAPADLASAAARPRRSTSDRSTRAKGTPPEQPAVPALVDAIIVTPKTGLRAIESSTGAFSYGVWGQSDSSQGTGVYGYAPTTTGTTAGVQGKTDSSEGIGVFGDTTATTGVNYGVYGRSASEEGFGVYGLASASSGTSYGVYGASMSSTGTSYGVYGRSYSPTGSAVYGYATSTTSFSINTGVHGETSSPQGIGVRGINTSSTGVNFGVYGESSSALGAGVSGYSYSGDGVRGSSNSSGAQGVSGSNSAGGVAVRGYISNGGVALEGRINENGGLAGNFVGPVEINGNVQITGDLDITGNLSKFTGTFKIDHPLDPANEYLVHSFVESPERMNIYNGNVTLDADGSAWVQLPNWFDALNRDFRYQLTALHEPAPGLYVAKTIAGNRFRIAGGKAGTQVSWQVTGVRHDAYARQHPMQVEEDKGDQRGLYLHPLELGMPEELAIHPTAHATQSEDAEPSEQAPPCAAEAAGGEPRTSSCDAQPSSGGSSGLAKARARQIAPLQQCCLARWRPARCPAGDVHQPGNTTLPSRRSSPSR